MKMVIEYIVAIAFVPLVLLYIAADYQTSKLQREIDRENRRSRP